MRGTGKWMGACRLGVEVKVLMMKECQGTRGSLLGNIGRGG